jgi:hypothetical protein
MCHRVKKLGFPKFLVAIILLSKIAVVVAQDLEPRAYTNVPVGLNFALAGYCYMTGGVIFDPSVPLDNAHINTHGTVLAYARSIKVGGMSGKVDVIVPYAWLSGTAEFDGQTVFRLSLNWVCPRKWDHCSLN